MITIKRKGHTHQIESDNIMSIQDTSDGLYLRLKDSSEIRLFAHVSAEIKAIPQIIKNSTADSIVVDLDKNPMIKIN